MPSLKFVTIEQLRRFAGTTAGATNDALLTDIALAHEDEILLRVPRFRDYEWNQGKFSVGETHSIGLDEEDDSIVTRHFPITGPVTVTDTFSGIAIDPDTFYLEHASGFINTSSSQSWPRGKNRYYVTYQGIAGETPPSLSLLVARRTKDMFLVRELPDGVRKYKVDNIEIENNPQSKQPSLFTDSDRKVINRFNDPFRNCTASY